MWRVGTTTTKLCMQQFYEDGIKRDGLLWLSDDRVQFLCNVILLEMFYWLENLFL